MLRISDAEPFRLRVDVPWHWLVLWGGAWSIVRGVVYECEVSYEERIVEPRRLGPCSVFYATIIGSVLQSPIDPTTGTVIQ
jgi:hypothetical protein